MGWTVGSCDSLCKGGPCNWRWEVGAPSWLELVAWLHSDICQNCFVKRSLVGPQVRLCCQFTFQERQDLSLVPAHVSEKSQPRIHSGSQLSSSDHWGRGGCQGCSHVYLVTERNLILLVPRISSSTRAQPPLMALRNILWIKLYRQIGVYLPWKTRV